MKKIILSVMIVFFSGLHVYSAEKKPNVLKDLGKLGEKMSKTTLKKPKL